MVWMWIDASLTALQIQALGLTLDPFAGLEVWLIGLACNSSAASTFTSRRTQ